MQQVGFGRRTFLKCAASAVASVVGSVAAHSQSALPNRPITLVVPFAAGGATDVVSRIVAKRLSERLSVPVVVENVSGAGGMLGAARVARGAPDGTVLLMGTIATHVINPLSAKQATYNPESDFTPISLLATVPNVLLVSPQVKANSGSDLIALLKANPNQYSYASSGIGTPPHLSGELFKMMAHVQMEHVSYRGGAPAMNDLMGGQIPVMFDVLTGAASFLRTGKVRALAVTTKNRSPSFPDIPTIAEAGLPEYETYTWNAVFAPAGLSKRLVEQLSAELRATVAEPEIQKRLRDLSADPVGSTPEELAAQLKAELAKWAPVVRAADLKQ
jgi:tripartite-type tricarboxylate transporter receptor subunit TctC